jgi:hypothetical protein
MRALRNSIIPCSAIALLACICAVILPAGSASVAAQEPAVDSPDLKLVREKVNTFFQNLTNKSIGGDGALRGIIGNSPLKNRNDDISKLIDQAASLDERYGAYVGHEEVSARTVGRDLVFLRYLYKGERFPVVWYFTFYRSGNGGREWMLIGLRFDSKVDALDR